MNVFLYEIYVTHKSRVYKLVLSVYTMVNVHICAK